MSVLVNFAFLGPMWVFVDNSTHQYPEVAVSANSGAIIKGGLEMAVIRFLFAHSKD